MVSVNQYIIHVDEGQYQHDLFVYNQFKDALYPTIDIVAEGDALINAIGQQQAIGKIIISFSKFSIDFGDLYFQIDDYKSSLNFSSCNLFRNGDKQAVNSHSLAVVNRGSFILENIDINGGNQYGNQPLILSISPKLIQFASLMVSNIALTSENTAPLLLNVTELTLESIITISDTHVKQNTAGTQADAGVIFIRTKEQVTCSKKDDTQIEPILVIENSEIIQNTLASISESSAILIDGLNPQQILIRSSTINNRSPPNDNKAYELKIALPKDCEPKDLINQLKDDEFGITLFPVAVKVPP
ncbi:MAG: hypothetical protein EZS28_031813, partial [Streblomastix strix]